MQIGSHKMCDIQYITAKEQFTYPDSAVPEMYSTILKILASFTSGNEKKWAHKCLNFLMSEVKDVNAVRQQWLKCPDLNKDEIKEILKLKIQKTEILDKIRTLFHVHNEDWENDIEEVEWKIIQNPALKFFWYGIIYCCITNKPHKNLIVNPIEYYYLEKVVYTMGNSYIKRKVDTILRRLIDESINGLSYGENQIKIDNAIPNNQEGMFNYHDDIIMNSLRWRTKDNQNYSVDYDCKGTENVNAIYKRKNKDYINTPSDNEIPKKKKAKMEQELCCDLSSDLGK